MNVDTFGAYVRAELEHWGRVYALHRDCEYLGHKSKDMLALLMEHGGEMPPKVTGFKPLEVDMRAQQIEDIVADIARDNRVLASVLRAYYCGQGRRKVERWETANQLLASAGYGAVSVRHYLTMVNLGEAMVSGVLRGLAFAA